jgi:hypothetical protein
MSLYSLSPNSDDATPGEGTLRVEVPHWSASVSVFDERHQDVAGDYTLRQSVAAPGTYEAAFSLAPGIYQVETVLGDQAVRELVPVQSDHTTYVAREGTAARRAFRIDASAPLAGAANTRARHQDAAAKWSQEPTWSAAPGGESQLFLFVRTLASDPDPGFAGGLKLLDAAGRLVTDFSSGVRRNSAQGWVACNADLPPGAYILRRGGRNISLRFQPLYLAAGWQTQVFLLAERYPRLHMLSLNMAPRGAGFRPDDESAMAAEVLLSGLSGGTSADLVLGNHIASLLSGKLSNPWLAIVAAHALCMVRQQSSRSAAAGKVVPARQRHVLTALEPLRDHPDAAALLLAADRPAAAPFWSPPLLRVSLRMIREHATRFLETVPDGSLTDLVLDDRIVNSPWTAWNTLSWTPTFGPDAASAAGHGRSLLKVRRAQEQRDEMLARYGATLARVATPAAPVYYLASESRESDWRIARLVPAVLAQAAAHEPGGDTSAAVAQTMIRPSPTATAPDAITVAVEQNLSHLLDDVNAHTISTSLGVPLARTAQSLERLQTPPAGDDAGAHAAGTAPPLASAVLDAIVDQTLRPIAREVAASRKRGKGSRRPAYIEECVPKLLGEADRLQAAAQRPPTGAGKYAARMGAAAERAHRIADELLAAAGYTVLTDPEGRIVFGNGAFRIFLSHALDTQAAPRKPASEAARQAAGQHAWETALRRMPPGNSDVPVPAPFSHHAGDLWRLQRTAVKDESGDTRAYLNVLHNPRGKPITGGNLRDIARVLPLLTQSVLLLIDGETEERDENLEEIERLVTELEGIVDNASA